MWKQTESGRVEHPFEPLILIATLAIAGAVQTTVDEGDFKTLWDGIWWAVVTVTTVGYGDLHPETVAGRIVGMVLMFVGIGFLAVLTAAISSQFVKADRQDEASEILEVLRQLQADVLELKARMPRS